MARESLSSTEPKRTLAEAVQSFERTKLPQGMTVADLLADDREGSE
jgi:hypothetical protein